jgi:hypothetical protein
MGWNVKISKIHKLLISWWYSEDGKGNISAWAGAQYTPVAYGLDVWFVCDRSYTRNASVSTENLTHLAKNESFRLDG